MTRLEKMQAFYKTLSLENVDLPYFADEDHQSFDDLRYAIESDNGFDVEIPYYGAAMEYLSNNDTSLRKSLGIAYSMGHSADNLNSETLASLLASENAVSEFNDLEPQIEAFFEELNNEEEEEEEEE